MAKTNLIEITINGVTMKVTQEQAIAIATACGQNGKANNRKESAPKKELVEFKKKDGTVKMVSAAQAKVWEDARKRSEDYKAVEKAITAEGRAYVKANPSCTRKEAAAHGCPHITKEELRALKVELGVRPAK